MVQLATVRTIQERLTTSDGLSFQEQYSNQIKIAMNAAHVRSRKRRKIQNVDVYANASAILTTKTGNSIMKTRFPHILKKEV